MKKVIRYGEEISLKKEELDFIAVYMDDDIREKVHGELAPCKASEFLVRYCELSRDFENLLKDEFGIEIEAE